MIISKLKKSVTNLARTFSGVSLRNKQNLAGQSSRSDVKNYHDFYNKTVQKSLIVKLEKFIPLYYYWQT